MKRSRHNLAKTLLAGLLLTALVSALWLGVVPARYLPFAPVDLADPSGPFLDMRLAALARDREQCESLVAAPQLAVAESPADAIARDGIDAPAAGFAPQKGVPPPRRS